MQQETALDNQLNTLRLDYTQTMCTELKALRLVDALERLFSKRITFTNRI